MIYWSTGVWNDSPLRLCRSGVADRGWRKRPIGAEDWVGHCWWQLKEILAVMKICMLFSSFLQSLFRSRMWVFFFTCKVHWFVMLNIDCFQCSFVNWRITYKERTHCWQLSTWKTSHKDWKSDVEWCLYNWYELNKTKQHMLLTKTFLFCYFALEVQKVGKKRYSALQNSRKVTVLCILCFLSFFECFSFQLRKR